MSVSETEIFKFFGGRILEEKKKLEELEKHLCKTQLDKEIKQIDGLWYEEVKKHKSEKSKLKLIIVGEAPISYEKYFYNYQGTFLNSLKEFWKLKTNRDLPNKMIENRVLLLDIYKYPLPPEFYKKDKKNILFSEDYILNKIDYLTKLELIGDETFSVFRYKQLFKFEHILGLNFLKDDDKLVSLNESEIPQKLNTNVETFLV